MDKVLSPVQTLSNLSGYQVEVLLSKARVRVLLNSRQSGKTTVLRAIVYKEALESKKDIMVLSPTHRSSKYNIFKVLFEGNEPIFPKQLIKSLNKTDMYVELVNGSTIRCSGLENVDAILGATIDLAIFDEAQSLSEDAINLVQPMLSTRNGRMVLAGTVRTRTNILWKYYEKGTLGHPDYAPGFRSWKVTVHDSPTPNNNPKMIAFLKSSMSKRQYNAEFLCDPDSGFGRVVPDFDNVLNRSTVRLDPDKPLLISCDFNVNPMAWAICQVVENEDKVRELHVIDELYVEDTTTQKMVNLVRNKYSQWLGKIIFYPDATGSARKTSSETTDHKILEQIGKVVTNKANPRKSDRVNSFNAMVCAADGTRRYFVNTRCKHIIASLLGLTYDKHGKIDKDGGLDHPFDATSYIVHKLFPIHSSNISQHSLNPD